jgi:hypothetical protein
MRFHIKRVTPDPSDSTLTAEKHSEAAHVRALACATAFACPPQHLLLLRLPTPASSSSSLAHLSISLSSARVVLEICLLASVSPRASGKESGVTRFSVSASVSQLVNTTTLLVWKVPPPTTCVRARETLFCSPCLRASTCPLVSPSTGTRPRHVSRAFRHPPPPAGTSTARCSPSPWSRVRSGCCWFHVRASKLYARWKS